MVYADYLEENGDPVRAEFIRIQCELANRHCELDLCPHGNCPNLRRRKWEIFVHSDSWWKPLYWILGEQKTVAVLFRDKNDFGTDYNVLEVRNGFVAEVSCRRDDWFVHGPEIVLVAPIEEVVLTDLTVEHPVRSDYFQTASCKNYVNGCPFDSHFSTEWTDGVEVRLEKRSEKEVLAATGELALRWARRKAGLEGT